MAKKQLRSDFHVLLDMDGVLANFVDHFCTWFGVPYPYDDPINKGKWDVVELTGLSNDVVWDEINDEDFWREIPTMPEAEDIVKAILDRFHPDNVCLLSSPGRMMWAMPGKILWIRKHFPQFQSHFLFGSQKQFCAHPDSVLIDDYEANVSKFELHGGQAFLVPRPWNHRYQEEPNLVQNLSRYLDSL